MHFWSNRAVESLSETTHDFSEAGPLTQQRVTSSAVAKAEDPADDESTGYTIDELAVETGVPSRTIRFYQAKGALPAPERRGRVAYYNDEHVERLKLVAELQERGLHLKAIRDLLSRADAGDVSVRDWLGLGDKLRAPWTEDRPRMCTHEELAELIGERSRAFTTELANTGLIRSEGDAHPPSFLVKSPGLLQAVIKLHDGGFELADAAEMTQSLRRRLSKAADEVALAFTNYAKDSNEASQSEIAESLDTVRSASLETVRLVFAQEMERALRKLVEHGKVLTKPSRRRRR